MTRKFSVPAKSLLHFHLIATFYSLLFVDGALKVHESFETARVRPAPAADNFEHAESASSQRRSPPAAAARFKYREFAETEFARPGYFPVPYVVGGLQTTGAAADGAGGDLRTLPIPSVDLSQLIRQHISHQREKLRVERPLIPSTILEGVSRITELRQTPFRRFADTAAAGGISYAEKRRRWKAELKRRLRGPKVPARPISAPPNGDAADASADGGGHYYVTYSPQTRVYQVSRRPPPNFGAIVESPPATSEQSSEIIVSTLPPIVLPTVSAQENEISANGRGAEAKMDELPPLVKLESSEDEAEDDSYEYGYGRRIPPRTTPTTTLTSSDTPTQRTYLQRPTAPPTVVTLTTKTTAPTTTTSTTTTPPSTTTTTRAPAIVVVQQTEGIPQNLTFFQQIRVATERPPTAALQYPTVKQIVHVDDYYQEIVDDEEPAEFESDGPGPEWAGPESDRHDFREAEPRGSSQDLRGAEPAMSERPAPADEEGVAAEDGRILESAQSSERESDDAHRRAQYNSYSTQTQSNAKSAPIIFPISSVRDSNPPPPYTPSTILRAPKYDVSAEAEDEDEEDDDDDDLFFWKAEPAAATPTRRASSAAQRTPPAAAGDGEPFEIVTHGVRRI